MTYFSDSLPPTFVRDWCRFRHSKATLIVAIVFYCIAWLTLFSGYDWKEIAQTMAAPDAFEYSSSDSLLLPMPMGAHAAVRQNMAMLSLKMFYLLLVPMLFVFPLRAASTVGADTKVQGTNFLQVTPLSTWRIVWGIWASSFSQLCLLALAYIPVILVRAYLMPVGDEYDWYYLLAALVFGGMYSAFFMFSNGLVALLRFVLLGAGIIFAIFLPFILNSFVFTAPNMENPGVVLIEGLICMALATLMLLLLARRPYAAPAENSALSVRALSFLCLLGAFALVCCKMYAPADITSNGAFIFPMQFLLYLALFGALMDAILPVYAMPVHALKTCQTLPAWPQMPGVLQSVLFALLGFYVLSVDISANVLAEVVEDCMEYSDSAAGVANMPEMSRAFLLAIPEALYLWFPLLIGVWLVDLMCRRNRPPRPLLVIVMSFACFMGLITVCGAISSLVNDLSDNIFIGIPYLNCMYYPERVLYGVAKDSDMLAQLCRCVLIGLVECGIFFSLLCLRVNSKSVVR